MEKTKHFDISSAGLHILAMLLMLCDHLWATLLPQAVWLTWLGRITFPIYAFTLVEGYFHTSNLKKYVIRLLIFALISEIPFNLMTEDSLFFPFHQNVLWTLLLGLAVIHINEKVRKSGKLRLNVLTGILSVAVGYVVGIITFVDYNAAGILTILAFYFFRGKKWLCYLGQTVSLLYINTEIISGIFYPITLFGMSIEFPPQILAVLAVIPIWLYNGRQGHKSRTFKWFTYLFYPVHMLLLYFIRQFFI